VKGIFSTYAGLSRPVYFLFVSRVINSAGSFIFPFLTLFLTQKLGFGEAAAGRFLLVATTVYVPGSLLGGKLADHAGRKIIMILFQLASALFLVPCAFLGNSPLVPWALILSSFFQGAVAPLNNAMVTDLTRPANRKAAFSLLYLGHNLGFAVSSVAAGALFNRYSAWIFLGDAATTLLSIAFLAVFVPESRPSARALQESLQMDRGPERAEGGSLASVLLRRPFLLAFLGIQIIYSFVYAQAEFALPLHLVRRYAEHGAASFGLLMSVNALAVIFLTTPVLYLTAGMPPARTVALAGVFYAVGFGMIGLAGSLPLLLLATLVWTLGEILSATSSGTYVADRTPMSHRGRVNALSRILYGVGHAASPPLVGPFIERFGVRLVWPCTFVLAALGSALLEWVHRRESGLPGPAVGSSGAAAGPGAAAPGA
jgi:MFS family permease